MNLKENLLEKSSKQKAKRPDGRCVGCCKPGEWWYFKEPEWYKIDGLSAI